MTDTIVIGLHELMLTAAWGAGWWTECECGWISNDHLTEARAIQAHERHKTAALAKKGMPR